MLIPLVAVCVTIVPVFSFGPGAKCGAGVDNTCVRGQASNWTTVGSATEVIRLRQVNHNIFAPLSPPPSNFQTSHTYGNATNARALRVYTHAYAYAHAMQCCEACLARGALCQAWQLTTDKATRNCALKPAAGEMFAGNCSSGTTMPPPPPPPQCPGPIPKPPVPAPVSIRNSVCFTRHKITVLCAARTRTVPR